jgi:hypothetical protein
MSSTRVLTLNYRVCIPLLANPLLGKTNLGVNKQIKVYSNKGNSFAFSSLLCINNFLVVFGLRRFSVIRGLLVFVFGCKHSSIGVMSILVSLVRSDRLNVDYRLDNRIKADYRLFGRNISGVNKQIKVYSTQGTSFAFSSLSGIRDLRSFTLRSFCLTPNTRAGFGGTYFGNICFVKYFSSEKKSLVLYNYNKSLIPFKDEKIKFNLVIYKTTLRVENKFSLVLVTERPKVIYLPGKLHNLFVRLKFKIITYFKD